jgi:hypothetical protein
MRKCTKYLAAIAVVIVGLAAPVLVTAQPAQKYAPRLADIMSAVQFRHLKLWTAGQQQNWELAAYELEQVKAGLTEAISFYTNIPVENVGMIDPPITSLDKSIAAKNGAGFKKAFNELTAGCNACHQSTGRGFIAMTVPAASPFSNQSFSPGHASEMGSRPR